MERLPLAAIAFGALPSKKAVLGFILSITAIPILKNLDGYLLLAQLADSGTKSFFRNCHVYTSCFLYG